LKPGKDVPPSSSAPDVALAARRSVEAARTSSIDAEREALSVAPAPQCELQSVSARPRLETLPGIGPDEQAAPRSQELEWTTTLDGERSPSSTRGRSMPPLIRTKPRPARRSSLLLPALALALSLGLGVFAWTDGRGVSSRTAAAPGVESDVVGALMAASPPTLPAPSRPLTLAPSLPIPSTSALVPALEAPPSEAQPGSRPDGAPGKSKPPSRPRSTAARSRAANHPLKIAATSNYQSGKDTAVDTDNPY
jgi:hypothetical protein